MSVPSVNSYHVVVSNEMGMIGSVGKQTGSLLRYTDTVYMYSGFEVTCPDCDLQSALDHAARDK